MTAGRTIALPTIPRQLSKEMDDRPRPHRPGGCHAVIAFQRYWDVALASIQGLPKVHVNALLNDTVATLAAARYLDGPDAIGSVIMGTGASCTGTAPSPQDCQLCCRNDPGCTASHNSCNRPLRLAVRCMLN